MCAKCLAIRLRGKGLDCEYCEYCEYTHILIEYRSFLVEYMALLIEYMTLLMWYKECVQNVCDMTHSYVHYLYDMARAYV